MHGSAYRCPLLPIVDLYQMDLIPDSTDDQVFSTD